MTRNLMKIIKNLLKTYFEMEAAVGFEPTNKGFADLRLRPLGNAAKKESRTPSGFERETGLEPATSTLARLRSTN